MNNKIAIQPVSIWANGGTKSAVGFRVTSITYDALGVSTGFFQLVDADDNVLTSSSVMASAAQTATWSDDAAFCTLLAQNAGLTPV